MTSGAGGSAAASGGAAAAAAAHAGTVAQAIKASGAIVRVEPDVFLSLVAGHRNRSWSPLRAAGPEVRARTGVLTEMPSLDERLTARENLAFAAQLFGVRPAAIGARVSELLERLRLSDRADHRVAGFSRGMKQAGAGPLPAARSGSRCMRSRRTWWRARRQAGCWWSRRSGC